LIGHEVGTQLLYDIAQSYPGTHALSCTKENVMM